MNTTQEHVTKLFSSKGVDHSNLWLEGERLRKAGFTVGHEYAQVWYKNKVKLVTGVVPVDEDVVKTVRRTVQAAGNAPLIRFEGVQVRRTFEGFTAVKCVYGNGTIEITGHKEEACEATNGPGQKTTQRVPSKNSTMEAA